MNFSLKSEYWDSQKDKTAFKKFILNIHGLDFNAWDNAGFWDDAYTPFSFFNGDEIVSSVCIYLMDAIVNGKPVGLVQISGVGTLAEFRRRGLSRELTDIGLEWARGKHEGIFLFADEDAIPYYQRCGFNAHDEYLEILEVEPIPSKEGITKLNPQIDTDLKKIFNYVSSRSALSDKFFIKNPKLDMFHVLYTLKDHIYEIQDLDCIICFKRDNSTLNIFDIVSNSVPTFIDIYPYISHPMDAQVKFHFYADKLGINDVSLQRIKDANLFVKHPFLIKQPVFPYTSKA